MCFQRLPREHLLSGQGFRSKKKESKKKKKDDKSRRGHSKHCKSRGCSKSTERQVKTNANTARRSDHIWGSTRQTNASTTKSTKDVDPAKYARNWESHSNADTNYLRAWAGLRWAAHRRTAAAAAMTATAWQPVTNDGAGARMVKNGLRYGERKLTKLKLKQVTPNKYKALSTYIKYTPSPPERSPNDDRTLAARKRVKK